MAVSEILAEELEVLEAIYPTELHSSSHRLSAPWPFETENVSCEGISDTDLEIEAEQDDPIEGFPVCE